MTQNEDGIVECPSCHEIGTLRVRIEKSYKVEQDWIWGEEPITDEFYLKCILCRTKFTLTVANDQMPGSVILYITPGGQIL